MASKNAARDPNTLANYTHFRAKHIVANYEIDFEKKRLFGNVILSIQPLRQTEKPDIVLDTSFLAIEDVQIDKVQATYELLPRKEPYGSGYSRRVAMRLAASMPKTYPFTLEIFLKKDC